MKKLNVKELNNELKGSEYSFEELDNFMMENGYYSIFNDGATSNIKDDKNVIYTAKDTNECEVKINFEITANNSEDEIEEAFYLKVINIKKF